MSKELKDTLNLPSTDFPMRASLTEREPQRIEHWKGSKLYERIQQKNKDGKAFILHDGPPFTNGDVHIGTALNKILKDTILRYKSMRGFRTPYVPGWDCHGLPIEHKVMKDLQKEDSELTPLAIRKACADFSKSYMEKQRGQFVRLGVLADWEREYKTLAPHYEAAILETFAHCVEQGAVYRSKKPVYWSIPCQTALAEAEIEYQDHNSPSIYVKFPISQSLADELPGATGAASIVIWTTTPWTLPANMGIALHEKLDYTFVNHEGNSYIVASELAQKFIADCGLEGASVSESTFKGKVLEHKTAKHPFLERDSLIVLGNHVTLEAGTGCVHTAPGHGLDDYFTGLEYELEIYCPLDDNACYIDDGKIPAELVGVPILDKKGKMKANELVTNILKEKSALVHYTRLEHSYPHCWRSKTPVIFRAMDQWFVSLDKAGTRDKALAAIEKTQWVPDWGEARIKGAVESRPDWCISRQRSWGTPLPAFFDEEGNALLDAKLIRGVAEKIREHGTDLWFTASAEDLLKGIELPEAFKNKTLSKGRDTLDVWIDSGSSHAGVLSYHEDLEFPADVYFEGSDQHRGWFQSSLWTSIFANKAAPYKTVITHGFVVNEQRRKISKSDKKPSTADTYVNQYGADIIRLWINSEDYRTDVPISEKILKQVVQTYRTLRNTLKFQLGNLYDFDMNKDAVAYEELKLIDQWALHETAQLIDEVTEAYDEYAFHKVYQLINRFCTVTLSSIYHDVLKDRLYTYGPDWTERRGSQTVIYHIFHTLTRLLAPILTFTADEAFNYHTKGEDLTEESIHLQEWPTAPAEWSNAKVAAEVREILGARDAVNEQLEAARKAKTLGQSLDAKALIEYPENSDLGKVLEAYAEDLAEWFIVSEVEIKAGTSEAITVKIDKAGGVRCPRSWRWVPQLVSTDEFGEVSERCAQALSNKYNNPQSSNNPS